MHGLGVSVKNICGKYVIQVYFKGNETLKNILVTPQDKVQIQYKSGIIYWSRCNEQGCNDEFIEESVRTFGERLRNT